jgi:predicted PurR-regulated permease PerM
MIMEYVFSALGILITGLVTWGTAVLVKWLNTKIANKEVAGFAATIVTVVGNAVKATYQAYVQAIKGTNLWTSDAQKEALKYALETSKAELTEGAINYIKETHGDVDKYLTTLIESILYDLKNGSKKVTVATEEK